MSAGDHQVAIVERPGIHFQHSLKRAGGGLRPVDRFEMLESESGKFVGLHVGSFDEIAREVMVLRPALAGRLLCNIAGSYARAVTSARRRGSSAEFWRTQLQLQLG